jgi:hypothetical protein
MTCSAAFGMAIERDEPGKLAIGVDAVKGVHLTRLLPNDSHKIGPSGRAPSDLALGPRPAAKALPTPALPPFGAAGEAHVAGATVRGSKRGLTSETKANLRPRSLTSIETSSDTEKSCS